MYPFVPGILVTVIVLLSIYKFKERAVSKSPNFKIPSKMRKF